MWGRKSEEKRFGNITGGKWPVLMRFYAFCVMVVFVGFLSSWLAKAETTKSYVFVWASSL
jgi:hypothetical protein